MAEPLVLVEQQDNGLVQLTLNDPEARNAMGEEMGKLFFEIVERLKADPAVRLVILRGAGKAFSAGGHLEMLFAKTKIPPDENERLMKEFYRYFLSLRDFPVPVIAAINGHAVGAGLCVALACDIRIAVDGAKLGLNFVRLGLHPGMAATYFLPRIVGPAVAAELLYRGQIISASQAAELGMINRVVSADNFDSAVEEVANDILSSGPQSIRELKESLRMSAGSSLEEMLNREAQCQAKDYGGAEFLEGITAAKEKRPAKF